MTMTRFRQLITQFGEVPNRSQRNAFINFEFPENRCSDSHTSGKGVNETVLYFIHFTPDYTGAVSKTWLGDILVYNSN